MGRRTRAWMPVRYTRPRSSVYLSESFIELAWMIRFMLARSVASRWLTGLLAGRGPAPHGDVYCMEVQNASGRIGIDVFGSFSFVDYGGGAGRGKNQCQRNRAVRCVEKRCAP